MKNVAFATLLSAIAEDGTPSWKDGLPRASLAFVRNCSVAIVIAVFFAVARNPSHVPRLDQHVALTDRHFAAGESPPSTRQ